MGGENQAGLPKSLVGRQGRRKCLKGAETRDRVKSRIQSSVM